MTAIKHPFDWHDDGVLWLINRVVFHPRGFALTRQPGADPEWTRLARERQHAPPGGGAMSEQRAQTSRQRRSPSPDQEGSE